jgi:tagatose-1,6-bisphosphate aldolase
LTAGADIGPLATADGRFTIAALDHRDALVAEFERAGSDTATGGGAGASASTGADALRRFKSDVLAALGEARIKPSAVMLEPEYSLPDLRHAVPDGVGVTCALEAQGYFDAPGSGNTVMEGWSPARVRSVGADGAKLLVLYRHDRGEFTEAQERLVTEVTAQAAEAGVPALIEPVPVDVVDDADRREVIVTAARRIGALGPMILKLPFPGVGACAEVTEAAAPHPWVLLSWGVTYDEFLAQLTEAMAAGCSGFAVGRALWREAVDPATRADFLAGTFQERLAELIDVVESATPTPAAQGESARRV